MADGEAPQASVQAVIRLDKWLWHARVTRTRTLAKKLVESGKVRVNRTRVVSPSRGVKVGDVLTIALPRAVLVYEIAALAERRGPYALASQLYLDRSAPVAETRQDAPGGPGLKAEARPDGRQRRMARRLAGKPG